MSPPNIHVSRQWARRTRRLYDDARRGYQRRKQLDAARILFEQFKAGQLNLIRQAVEEAWQENLLLDFKTLKNHAAPMTTDDRQSLAEALSGFANSDGGIIVWGIDARRTAPPEPDAARELQPIGKLRLFRSDLERDTPQVVSPGIVGVEHFPIPDPDARDSGYVVTFVPKSQTEIHMACAKEQFRYYYRSGASFLPMEAYMVADRLGTRPQPKLELDWRAEKGSQTGDSICVRLVLGIKNVGQSIALYPAIAFYENASFKLDPYGLDGNRNTGLPERVRTASRPQEAHRIFAGGANDAIYPGTTLDVTCVASDIPLNAAAVPDLQFRYELYCEGFSATSEASIPLMREFQRLRES